MSLVAALEECGFPWVQMPRRHPQRPILNAQRVGNLVFASGQVPIENGKVLTGKVSQENIAEAQRAAMLCAVWSLFAAGSVVDPESITGVATMQVYVNVADGFNDTSTVADGASDMLRQLLGEAGEHSRAAIGVAALPLDALVEITLTFTVR